MLVCRPCSDRYRMKRMLDINKPCILHPFLEMWSRRGFFAHHISCRLQKLVVGDLACTIRRKGIIRGSPFQIEIGKLHVATRVGELESLFHQSRPVFDAYAHASTVDEVEFLRVCPFLFNIVDFESNVRRYPLRMHVRVECARESDDDDSSYHRDWIGLRSLPNT